MCGLAGVLAFDGNAPRRALLDAMSCAVAHRGPDAAGVLVDDAAAPALGLAHRRLAIIDTSHAADQPIGGCDGLVQVALNGEIYNFRELRSRLAAHHRFVSEGDSEVIAHLYEERGEAAIAELDGMFALALWDARARRLLLARDRFGKKPLYWFADAERLVFGSEIKSLLAAGVPAELDEDPLGEYLALGYVPAPRTLFRGIRRLPPASILTADLGGVHGPREYWRLRFPAQGEAAQVPWAEAVARVRDLLKEAVKKRLVADVPVGLLLSGGVDSAAVAAFMAREAPGQVRTFTVGFEGDAYWDERKAAAEIAAHLGTVHHATVVRPQAAQLIETLLHHHDEPFGDSSALPTYLVAQEARRHVTVALNGDGGDETFAGYDRFWAALLAASLPSPLKQVMRKAASILPTTPMQAPLPRLRRFAQKAALPLDERLFSWGAFFDLDALRAIDADHLARPDAVLASYRVALAECAHASPLSQALHLDFRTYLLDDLLPKMDRMTMAHGLEGRSPLLDTALVEYVATLPDEYKRRGRHGKIILKEAIKDLVPPGVLTRRKHGFGVPLGQWFRGELRPMAEDLLLGQPRLARWVRKDAVVSLLDEHRSGGHDHGHRLWTLLTLELWLRRHRFA